MSLIPLFIIILLIVGAGYFLMKGEIKLPKFLRGPQLHRVQGFPTVVYTQNIIEKQRKVIKSQQELDEFLKYVDSSGLLTVNEKINFDKDFVIAVSSETEEFTDNSIKIKKVYEDKKAQSLLISVRETVPGESCQPEVDKNVSVDIVTIDKTDWTIEFERIKEIQECKEQSI